MWTVTKEIDLETGDNTTAETKNPPKRGARKCKQLNKTSKLAVLNRLKIVFVIEEFRVSPVFSLSYPLDF